MDEKEAVTRPTLSQEAEVIVNLIHNLYALKEEIKRAQETVESALNKAHTALQNYKS